MRGHHRRSYITFAFCEGETSSEREREREREVTTSAGQRRGIEKRIFLRLSSLLRFSDTVVQARMKIPEGKGRWKMMPGGIEN